RAEPDRGAEGALRTCRSERRREGNDQPARGFGVSPKRQFIGASDFRCQAAPMRVLVVEDERHLAGGIKRGLEAEGFAVDIALDGPDGLERANEGRYDAIVLDIMLPGMNGYKVCSALREAGHWTPILMLTAKDGELDEAEALDTGADDFLTKPFSFVVLTARLRALMRRGAPARPAVLTAGDLKLDPASHLAWRADDELNLTAPQFALPQLLIRPVGQV